MWELREESGLLPFETIRQGFMKEEASAQILEKSVTFLQAEMEGRAFQAKTLTRGEAWRRESGGCIWEVVSNLTWWERAWGICRRSEGK